MEDKEAQTPHIKEIDLTNEDVYGLQERLTELIKQGNVLHGTTNGDLETLEPRESKDGYKPGVTIKAVFATDSPVIALARGAAGEDLRVWTRQLAFVVSENWQISEDDVGYIYIIDKEKFRQNPKNVSEFLSNDAVQPDTVVKFSAQTMSPFFRSMKEVKDSWDEENNALNKNAIRESDIDGLLLTLRNYVALSFLDSGHDTITINERIPGLMIGLKPALERFKEIASPEQRKLGNEVYSLYKYSMFESDTDISRPNYMRDYAELVDNLKTSG